MKWKEALKNDPFFHHQDGNELKVLVERSAIPGKGPAGLNTGITPDGGGDPNEIKIMEKLELLKKELNKKNPIVDGGIPDSGPNVEPANLRSQDESKLDHIIAAVNTKRQVDPEIEQLSGMLDKILKIQQPPKMDSTHGETPAIRTSYSASTTPDGETYGEVDSSSGNSTGFFELCVDTGFDEDVSHLIEAVVDETQTLVAGSTVKMRLSKDIYIKGIRIQEGQFVYGTVSISSERLKISVNSIYRGNILLPVSLEVYDLDGISGIYIPGSVTRESGKQSADQAMGSLGLMAVDPSVGAQAATAGIQAAKSLLSKKVRQVKVTVLEGHHVILKDTNINR